MRKLSTLQRNGLIRRLSREIAWWTYATQSEREHASFMAGKLVDALEWTGVHGASEKRAVELIVSRLEEEATA